MNNTIKIISVITMFLCAGNALPSQNAVKEKCFKIIMPDGFQVQKDNVEADFYIIGVGNKDKEFINIYFGHNPNFSPQTDKYELEESSNKKIMKYLSDDGSVIKEEILIKNQKMEDAFFRDPPYAHAWTLVTDPDELGAAIKIIESIEIDDDPKCRNPKDTLTEHEINHLKNIGRYYSDE